jgi:hypothetical protein
MSVTVKNSGLPGAMVVKAAQNLPQNATATLFTVTGGSVLVQFMAGLVTTALGATVTSLSVGNTPTGGANVPASIATSAVVTSTVVGNLYVPTFAVATGVAAAPLQGGVIAPINTLDFIVPAGVITWTTTANDTGQMKWYLQWTALDPGAFVS